MDKVEKGWGFEQIIHNADGYCGKILNFKKGRKCSYHYHEKKTETFYCLGKVLLRYGFCDDVSKCSQTILVAGDIFHVPVGMRHQIEAIEDSRIFEFSNTDYPDDSIRVANGDSQIKIPLTETALAN